MYYCFYICKYLILNMYKLLRYLILIVYLFVVIKVIIVLFGIMLIVEVVCCYNELMVIFDNYVRWIFLII